VSPNFVLALTPQPNGASSAKVLSGYTPNSKVISAHLLQFKPIFDPSLKKVVRGAPVPGGGCTSKTWSFSSACKNLGAQHPLGAEICSSKKCTFGGYKLTSRSPRLLDRSSPDLFRLMREESLSNV